MDLYNKLSNKKKIIKKFSDRFQDEYLMVSIPGLKTHITIWKKPFVHCNYTFHIAAECHNNKRFHEWLAYRDGKFVKPFPCNYVKEDITFRMRCPEMINKYNEDRKKLLETFIALLRS